MKKLEELGISPAPWKVGGDGHDVANDKNEIITDDYDQFSRADARLIAAAPKLYKYLFEAAIDVCHNCSYSDPYPPYECHNKCNDCFVWKWRDALAEAAGERED